MIRSIIVFLSTFVVGAVVALAARAALYEPHSEVTTPVAEEHATMVDNASRLTEPMAASQHEGHAAGAAAKEGGEKKQDKSAKAESERKARGKDEPKSAVKTPVNTLCAICGMEVDPTIPTVEYQGKTIGFGCRMCPPKFKANPDKYGPAYLRNEVIEN